MHLGKRKNAWREGGVIRLPSSDKERTITHVIVEVEAELAAEVKELDLNNNPIQIMGPKKELAKFTKLSYFADEEGKWTFRLNTDYVQKQKKQCISKKREMAWREGGVIRLPSSDKERTITHVIVEVEAELAAEVKELDLNNNPVQTMGPKMEMEKFTKLWYFADEEGKWTFRLDTDYVKKQKKKCISEKGEIAWREGGVIQLPSIDKDGTISDNYHYDDEEIISYYEETQKSTATNQPTNQPTTNQPTTNKLPTTNKERTITRVIMDVEVELAAEVQMLDLNGNSVETLGPKEELVKFKRLTELNCHDCRLDDVPTGIEELPSLEKINLQRNNLHSLPRALVTIGSLKWISASDNVNLTTIPTGKHLTHLHIRNCNVRSLEYNFFHHRLEEVDMSGNKGEAK